MTETCRDPRDWKRITDGEKYLPLTDYQGVRGRSELGTGPWDFIYPFPSHVSGRQALDPAPAPAAPPLSCSAPGRTPRPTHPRERGGARGADWWVQKFKPNSFGRSRRNQEGEETSWGLRVGRWGGE